MRLFRLAKFNINKHRSESVSLAILMFICTAILCSSVSSIIDVQTSTGRLYEEYNCLKNQFLVGEEYYHEQYDGFLYDHEDVRDFTRLEFVKNTTTGYVDKNGKEISLFFSFMDRENEEKLEAFRPESHFTEDEIKLVEHPVYAPYYVKDTLNFEEGDMLAVIYNGRQFPFTIVGFYETCVFNDANYSVKLIVCDEDYYYLRNLIGRYRILAFNTDGDSGEKVRKDFVEYVEDNTSNGEQIHIEVILYEDVEFATGGYLKILLCVMSVMALVTLTAALIMIRHRIGDDIREQVVSIGVLEALGYTGREIMLSYIYEYLILAICGIVPGIAGAAVLNSVIHRVGVMLTGHHYTMQIMYGAIAGLAVLLVAFVLLVAYLRARRVYKYPPVLALRKGLSDHHFGKNVLPLSQTKGNVHFRLALKGAYSNLKESIGIGVCILIATVAVVVSLLLFQFADDSMSVIYAMTGMEMSDLDVSVSEGTDVEAMRQELLRNPGVERIILKNQILNWDIQYDFVTSSGEKITYAMAPVVYEKYDDIRQIRVLEGRFPKYDNEVMVTKLDSNGFGLKVGDSYTIKHGKVEKDYIICGIVSSVTDNGHNLYLTAEGYKRIKPNFELCTLGIFLKEGVDRDEFSYWLSHEYGRSMEDALKGEAAGDSLEERIKAIADKKMAVLMAEYGVGHVEYSVNVNGEQISGSSSVFKTKNVMSLKGVIMSQLGGAMSAFSIGSTCFMVIALLVVMIIMIMIMSAAVKSQRSELGIYKGMGYTSKDLRLQLAFRIVPSLVISVVFGTIVALFLMNVLNAMIGSVPVNIIMIILADVGIILFAFGTAYIGTRKISSISVYELMTE